MTDGSNPGVIDRLVRLDDGNLLKAVFYGLLGAVAVALYLDYTALRESDGREYIQPGMEQPILPPYVPQSEPGTDSPQAQPANRPDITTDPADLRRKLSIDLKRGGVLALTGTIDVGSSGRFAEKLKDFSEYVERIELNSPGGSVQDALAISKAIRESGLPTRVNDGALCASSCPLVLAGGIVREAGQGAAIGVHQIYAAGNTRRSADAEISGTQQTTAEITRHLDAMGVEPALWLHALETPPAQLYYLSPEELTAYQLVTELLKTAQ